MLLKSNFKTFFLTRLFFIILLVSYTCCSKDNNCCSKDDNPNDYRKELTTYKEGEEFPTGELSVNSTSNNAFGHSIPTLTNLEEIEFATGNSLFNQSWVTAPSSTSGLDGLGPTFNAKSCSSCHFKDGRGKPIQKIGKISRGFLMRLSIAGENNHGGPVAVPNYGDQLQTASIFKVENEASISATYEIIKGSYPDGTEYELQKPIYKIFDEKFGSLQNVLSSPRVGNQVIGLGFVDALAEREILKNEDEFDSDNDGISGKANYVWNVEKNKATIGKFGWKANQPTLKQQIAGAFNGDIGLTSSIFPMTNCPSPQKDCLDAHNGGEPEITERQMQRVTFYQSALAVPKRRNYKKDNVLQGKMLFHKMECIKCHQINFKTSSNYPFNSYLENITINPYSDFLLHDMGDALADGRPDFKANGKEWRTQPLWGIGLIKTVNKHTFLLHDGRARNIEEAILWHGGEAEKAKRNFKALSKKEREQLISFINSL